MSEAVNPSINKLIEFFADGNFEPTRKYYEIFKFGYNLALLEAKGTITPSDAVDFMNWTLGGDCTFTCTDEDSWTHESYDINDDSTRKTYSTQEVYEEYLKYLIENNG